MVRPVGLSRGITACHPLRQTGHRHKPEDRSRPYRRQADRIGRFRTPDRKHSTERQYCTQRRQRPSGNVRQQGEHHGQGCLLHSKTGNLGCQGQYCNSPESVLTYGDSHKGIQYRYRCVRKQRQDYSRRELQARGRHQLRKQIRTGRNRCQDKNGRHIVQGSKLLLQKIRCLYVGFIPQSVRGTPRHGDRKRQPQRLGSQQNGHININCQNQRLQPQREHRIQQKHIIFIKDFQLFRDQKRIPFIVQHERKPVLQRRLAQRWRQCQKR